VSDWLSGRIPFNFLGADDDPTGAVTAAALDRLSAVKATQDPHGVIRSNRPIPVGRVPTLVMADDSAGKIVIERISER
jgi:hypothetical protein